MVFLFLGQMRVWGLGVWPVGLEGVSFPVLVACRHVTTPYLP